MATGITVTPPSANITEAMHLVGELHRFAYDAQQGDAAAGAVLASEAQVYATLALTEAVDNLTDTIYTAAERIAQAIEGTARA